MFVDEAHITVKAGKGGDGACSFRREKFVPRGGPDGGDGGNGGSVILRASYRLSTLLDLRYQQHYEAKPGDPGQGRNKHGKTAADVIVVVPVGTSVLDDETGDILADLTEDNQAFVAVSGGQGGRGNSHFATSTNQTPTRCEPGRSADERRLRLKLKLLADVGLIGLPNAGKSTLIAAISAARPKIADYPFTTLVPNLGVVRAGDDRSFVVADIPGLIEGAHEGKGLGQQFLRHIERTSVLLYVIDISEWAPEDPVTAFEILRHELVAYDASLRKRPFAVVATKLDLKGDGTRLSALQTYCKKRRIRALGISAATREGLDDLVRFLAAQIKRLRQVPCASNS
ncbi:GTPase Obg [Nitrospira sp.]|nr:GTPase Obg [Nitrospira sp.]